MSCHNSKIYNIIHKQENLLNRPMSAILISSRSVEVHLITVNIGHDNIPTQTAQQFCFTVLLAPNLNYIKLFK